SDQEINRMKEEAQQHAEDDRKQREKVDKLNAADSLIFQTEKQIKEFGDKLPADKKTNIEDALTRLKDAHRNQDLDAIDKATADLNQIFQAASEEMYRQGQQAGPQPGADEPKPGGGNSGGGPKDQEVTDVDFEEVK
ncbi:MAG: Hsp70 family protein, partial [Bacteroidales bacterium]